MALDAARIWVVAQELRTAAQACALSAVVELDGTSVGVARAAVTGSWVGGLMNRKNFQSAPAGIGLLDVQFANSSQGPWLDSTSLQSAGATFVRCKAKEPSLALTLGKVFGVASESLGTTSVAGLAPSQASCATPIGVCSAGSDSNFGLLRGQLISADFSAVLGTTGYFRWVNLSANVGGSGLQQIAQPLISRGSCAQATKPGRCIGLETGKVSSLVAEWNTRFGVYKSGVGNYAASEAPPALSGKGYDASSCKPQKNGLLTVQVCAGFDQYQRIDEPNGAPHQGGISGYRVDAQAYAALGLPRRRVSATPVVECNAAKALLACGAASMPVVGWACVFLRNAIGASGVPELEFLGRADDPLSPCRGVGVSGSASAGGPLVAVLVQ